MAFEMWMSSLQPMVTLVKTWDVSRLVKVGKRRGMKFNMLLCWCIGKAASEVEEFYTLPERLRVGEHSSGMNCKLFRYDRLAINAIVQNCKGGLNFCDIAFTDDLQQFNRDYLRLTTQAASECITTSLEGYMLIGTSAVIQTELDCMVNQYNDKFLNPMVFWAKYRKRWFKTTLPVSFQFHHVQMDGSHAARFLQRLQDVIYKIEK